MISRQFCLCRKAALSLLLVMLILPLTGFAQSPKPKKNSSFKQASLQTEQVSLQTKLEELGKTLGLDVWFDKSFEDSIIDKRSNVRSNGTVQNKLKNLLRTQHLEAYSDPKQCMALGIIVRSCLEVVPRDEPPNAD